MKTFHDFDVEKKFFVQGEQQTIEDGHIKLDHTPFTGTLQIEGYRRNLTGLNMAADEFYIDYHERSGYKLATQIVTFGPGNEGITVTASYTGVGTIVFARDMNEIKDFMDTGAEQLVDGKVAAHEAGAGSHADIRADIRTVEGKIQPAIEAHDADEEAHADIRSDIREVGEDLESYKERVPGIAATAAKNAADAALNTHNYAEDAHPIILRRIEAEADRLESLIGTTMVYRGEVETFSDLPRAEPADVIPPDEPEEAEEAEEEEEEAPEQPAETEVAESDEEDEETDTDWRDEPEPEHYAQTGDVYRVLTAAPEYGVRAYDFVVWTGESWLPLAGGAWDAIEAMGKRLDIMAQQVAGCCEINSWFIGTGGSGIDHIPAEDEIEPVTSADVDDWFTPTSSAPLISADGITSEDVDDWFVGTQDAEDRRKAEIDEIMNSPLPEDWVPAENEIGIGDVNEVVEHPVPAEGWEPADDELTKPDIHEAVNNGNVD